MSINEWYGQKHAVHLTENLVALAAVCGYSITDVKVMTLPPVDDLGFGAIQWTAILNNERASGRIDVKQNSEPWMVTAWLLRDASFSFGLANRHDKAFIKETIQAHKAESSDLLLSVAVLRIRSAVYAFYMKHPKVNGDLLWAATIIRELADELVVKLIASINPWIEKNKDEWETEHE